MRPHVITFLREPAAIALVPRLTLDRLDHAWHSERETWGRPDVLTAIGGRLVGEFGRCVDCVVNDATIDGRCLHCAGKEKER